MISRVGPRLRAMLARLAAHLRMPLYRNGYLLTLSSLGSAVFGLLFWALAARFYSAEVVGQQSALLSAIMLLAGIAVLSLNNVLVRFGQSAGRLTYRLVGLSYAIGAGAALVVGLVFIKSAVIWFPSLSFLNDSPIWFGAFLIATIGWCIFSLQDYALIGLRQTHWIPLENLLFSLAKIVFLVLFSKTLADFGLFAAWHIPVLLSLLPVNWLIFRRIIPQHIRANAGAGEPLVLRQLVRYASGNYLGTLFSLAGVNLLPVLVVSLAGAKANAYFYLPWTIVTSLQILALNMTTSLTVEAAVDQTHLALYCRRVLINLTRLLLPIVIVMFAGAPLFLSVFGREYAAEGTPLLRWLVLSSLPNAVVMLGIGLARVQNRANVVALVQAALCGLGLGLSTLWLPKLGLAGIGVAWLVTQTAVAVVVGLVLLRPVLWPKALAPGQAGPVLKSTEPAGR